MTVTAEQITIAITVYNRRDYLLQAIASALDQTKPVRVMVVEDAGPDPGMQAWVLAKYGARIRYHRHARRRGLFDNWNACLELCPTPWLSILHDDDYLKPNLVDTLGELSRRFPGRGLYFGGFEQVDEAGNPLRRPRRITEETWGPVDPELLARYNGLGFPGHLLNVAQARSQGGFRAASQYCGDWEMWFRMAWHHGAARTSVPVAFIRESMDDRRATSRVIRSGRNQALTNVQRKRNYALLQPNAPGHGFDRRQVQRQFPLAVKYLLDYGAALSPRLLAYHAGLLLTSASPTGWHALYKCLLGCLGWRFAKMTSAVWRRFF